MAAELLLGVYVINLRESAGGVFVIRIESSKTVGELKNAVLKARPGVKIIASKVVAFDAIIFTPDHIVSVQVTVAGKPQRLPRNN